MFLNIEKLNSLRSWAPGDIPSLDGIRAVLSLLDDPQDSLKCIHVAGTNGKGSVCVAIASILGSAGYKVGMTISPHLEDITERIVIDGSRIRHIYLETALGEVFAAAASIGTIISYFEAIICAAFVIFRSAQVDFCVIEVGLGGLWDATNIISKPVATVITSIGLDHEETLGSSINEITKQKAGIIKQGVDVFIGNLPEESKELVSAIALKNQATIRKYASDFWFEGNVYRNKSGIGIDILPALKGWHQYENAAVAADVALSLGIESEHIVHGLNHVYWPGRLEEIVFDSKKIIFDAAHNRQGIEILAKYLDSIHAKNLHIIFGALKTKRWQEMVEVLQPYSNMWGILEADSLARASLSEMQNYLSGFDINSKAFSSPGGIIEYIKQQPSNSTILICGSIYMMSRVRSAFHIPNRLLWSRNNSISIVNRNKSLKEGFNVFSSPRLNIYAELHDVTVNLFNSEFARPFNYLIDVPSKLLRSQIICSLELDLLGQLSSSPKLGAALELLHCATLVHDDLPALDDSPVRRGKPALHLAFGEAKAILAADIVFGIATSLGAEHSAYAAKILSEAIRDVSIGQILDIGVEKNGEQHDRAKINRLKTGTLFAAACKLGVLCEPQTPEQSIEMFANFGLLLGEVFQLRDDMEDSREGAENLFVEYSKKRERVLLEFAGLEKVSGKKLKAFKEITNQIAPEKL